MRIQSRIAILASCLVLALLGVHRAAAEPPTPEQWREDFRFLVERLTNLHPNAFYSQPREAFESRVKKLEQDIPSLEPNQVALRLIEIAASVADGHTALFLPIAPFENDPPRNTDAERPPFTHFRKIPAEFYIFSDGLFLRRAPVDKPELAGSRVVRIGRATADEALKAVEPLCHRDRVVRRGNVSASRAESGEGTPKPDDNSKWFEWFAPSLLNTAEVLDALGLVESPDSIPIILRDASGNEKTVNFDPLKPGVRPKLVDSREAAGSPVPRYLKTPQNAYWFETLEDGETVYLQINSIQNKQGESFYQFCPKLFRHIDENSIKRLVIDIRLNGGGDNTLNRALINPILKREAINRRDTLFVIIGRNTFSAASNLAIDLDRMTNAVFVGEPNGNCINFFGDAEFFTLPNSGLRGRCSTLYWQAGDPRDARRWIEPEIPAPLTSADYAAGRDPALEAILRTLETTSSGF